MSQLDTLQGIYALMCLSTSNFKTIIKQIFQKKVGEDSVPKKLVTDEFIEEMNSVQSI